MLYLNNICGLSYYISFVNNMVLLSYFVAHGKLTSLVAMQDLRHSKSYSQLNVRVTLYMHISSI